MAKRDPNRIQVDLKLLQDKNLRALKEFGDQFSKSVDRLSGVLERGGGLGGGGDGGGTGGARRGGTGPPGDYSRAPTDEAPGQGPAVSGGNWFTRQIAGQAYGPGLSDFEKAQFNLGNIGQMDALAQMRYISHIFSRAGWNADEKPRGGYGLGAVARGASGLFGMVPRAGTYFQSARGVAGQLYNYNIGPTMFGQNLGLSRQGGIGAGFAFGSPAWMTGVGANLRAGVRSWFGFNPNYSTAQAQEAMSAVNNYGYDGHLANRMLDTMKNVTQSTGIDATSQMQLFDPAMRFGTDSMQGVVDMLYQIPRAANAARMGLSQFTADLTSAAQGLSQDGNMTMAGAARGLMAFSGATGLAPSKGAAIMSDQRNLWMTSGITGQNLYQLTFGTHAASARTGTAVRMAEQIMGMPMSDWHRLAKTNQAEYQARMSNLIAVQMSDPSLFGGMNVKDLMNIANHPHRLNRMRADETLQRVGEMKNPPNWNSLMSEMGLSEGGKAHFRAYQLKLASEHLRPHEVKMKEAEYLRNALRKIERDSSERARVKTLFDLTPAGHRLLRFMDRTLSKPTSNSGGDARTYASQAIHNAQTAGLVR